MIVAKRISRLGQAVNKGNIQVVATLNGQPWSGNITLQGYSVEENSYTDIETVTVPLIKQNINTPYHIQLKYISGGPINATFIGITPNVQLLNPNQTITFSVNFSSLPTAKPASTFIPYTLPSASIISTVTGLSSTTKILLLAGAGLGIFYFIKKSKKPK